MVFITLFLKSSFNLPIRFCS